MESILWTDFIAFANAYATLPRAKRTAIALDAIGYASDNRQWVIQNEAAMIFEELMRGNVSPSDLEHYFEPSSHTANR